MGRSDSPLSRRRVMSSSAANSESGASQVPPPICRDALSPFTPESPAGASVQGFPVRCGLHPFRRTGHSHWCNEAESGLLNVTARRFAPTRLRLWRLLSTPLVGLHAFWTLYMVNSSQFTRSARFILAHRKTRKGTKKLDPCLGSFVCFVFFVIRSSVRRVLTSGTLLVRSGCP